jgi:hypothetical protein
MDDPITMRDKILLSNNCTSSYQRMVVYLGMAMADRLILQGDLVMGESGGVGDVHSSHSEIRGRM